MAALPVLVLALLILTTSLSHAAGGPFGVATPDTTAPAGGPFASLVAWSARWQSVFYRELTASLRDLATNPWAGSLLVGLSFLYGVFHAVGPGHGKAVITSYLLATGETLRRGVLISFASALLQAVSAIAIVLVFTIGLGATAMTIGRITDGIELASYALITLLGLALLWRKAVRPLLVSTATATTPDGIVLSHANDNSHSHHHHHHDHAHGAECGCGHAHAADPAMLTGPFDWRRAGAAALAVGIRPCSGALIVLVFALSQGLFAAGILSTLAMAVGTGLTVSALAVVAVFARGTAVRLTGEDGAGFRRAVRGMEILAALVILGFGALMLSGALAARGYL